MPTRLSASQPQSPWLALALGTYLTRATVRALLHEQHSVRLYWRVLTPLVVLWGMLYQRLQGHATLDDVVSGLQAGYADGLDAADPHCVPLSARLRSVSTAAYHQARQRLPLELVRQVRERIRAVVLEQQVPRATQTWRGLYVRGLDGTTFRLPPAGDLPDTYGRARGKCGTSHWVTAQAVVTFCWASWLVVAHAESAHAPSETTLVRHVLSADAEPAGPGTALYIADRGFGIYRTVQVATHAQQHVLLRLDPRYVAPILGFSSAAGPVHLAHGTDRAVRWAHRPHLACEADLPCPTVSGRLLFVQLHRPGFRPRPLYLFTTLCDATAYPLADLVALYAERWQVELRYRDLKTTLAMEYFDVRSAAMFAKELEIGLLAYSLIRLAMLAATSPLAAPDLPAARRLAFAACRRRLRDAWRTYWAQPPAATPTAHLDGLCHHLAACRLRPVTRPRPVPHEPRAVRRVPQPYPALKGLRQAARATHLAALGAISS